MADINAYALGLELQIQKQPALQAIDEITKAVKILQEMMGSVPISLMKGTRAATVDAKILREATDLLNNSIHREMELQQQYLDVVTQANAATFMSTKAQQGYEDQLKSIAKEMAINKRDTDDFLKKHRAVAKLLAEERDHLKGLQKSWSDNTHEIERHEKNQKLVAERYLSAAKALGNLTPETQQLTSVVSGAIKTGTVWGAVLVLLGMSLKSLIDMQEVYRMTNYRALGSQYALMQATTRLGASYGASADEAMKVQTALLSAGFVGVKNLDKLAEANFKFSQATGVSVSTAALFQRRIVDLTNANDGGTKVLGQFAAVMRKSGIAGQQLDSIMGDLNSTMLTLNASWNAAAITNYALAIGQLSGAAHRAGVSGAALRSLISDMSSDILGHAKQWTVLGVAIREVGAGSTDATRQALAGMGNLMQKLEGRSPMVRQAMLKAYGLPPGAFAEYQKIEAEARKAGQSVEQFMKSQVEAADLNKDWTAATDTLTQQLKQLLQPLLAITSSVVSVLVPALSLLLKPITWLLTKFGDLVTSIQKIEYVGAIFNAVMSGVIGLALIRSIGLVSKFKAGYTAMTDVVSGSISMFKSVKGWITGIGSSASVASTGMTAMATATKAVNVSAQASSKVSPTAGLSIKTFLSNLAEGIKSFGNAQVLKGVLVLGLLTVMVAGTILGLAYAMTKLGISAKDMIAAAAAMVITAAAVWVLSLAVKAMSSPGAIKGALILIAVVLALGVATLLAGIGIGFMAKGFAELFKAIPDIATFLVVMGAMVVMMPTLAVGIAILGLSIAASAPFILAGMAMLLASAMMALIINPIFEDFGKSISSIGQAVANIGADAGMRLLNLAAGITAFMSALLAIGVAGGVASIFGKSPLKQAQEIAAAMDQLAKPANALASALDKIGNIKDVFKPFIDSVLGRKDEIQEAIGVITNMSEQVMAAEKQVDAIAARPFPFSPLQTKTEPIRKPLIGEDMARRMREDRNQALLVEGTKSMKGSLEKIHSKISSDTNRELIELLKEYLPKLVKDGEDPGSLASAANEW